MKTVGEILQSARKKKHLTIAAISHHTKIQKRFIKALEEDDYKHLPESTFVKGFIRNYAQVVGKDPKVLLAVLRRDYSEDSRGKVVPRGLVNPLNKSKLRWTPQITIIAAASPVFTIFIAYLILQFRLLSGVPTLTIKTPKEDEVVSALVTVEGTTAPQATITINSKQIEVNEFGDFAETIGLTSGKHTITIVAESRTGKTKTLQRTVVVE